MLQSAKDDYSLANRLGNFPSALRTTTGFVARQIVAALVAAYGGIPRNPRNEDMSTLTAAMEDGEFREAYGSSVEPCCE